MMRLKKPLNSSTGMASPNGELVERTELNKLTSALLMKILLLKKIPERIKLKEKRPPERD